MSLLFDHPLIAGLEYRDNFIAEEEEQQILSQLRSLDMPPFRLHGWVGNRRTLSFGWRYDFDDARFVQADPLPDWLMPLRVKAASLAGVPNDDFVHVLLARYDSGAGIGWHRDRPVFEEVAGISLASSATMRFRQRTETGFRRASIELAPRSAYLLRGEVRHDWEHSIVPGTELRFSITFRTLSKLGRRKAEDQRIS
ncbi:MAG: alpha-ketoglutarate-dependent dioxygenase AlkB [Sphingomicrobium sp.]